MSVVGGQAKLGSLTLTLLKLDNVTAVCPDWQLQDYHVETPMLTKHRYHVLRMGVILPTDKHYYELGQTGRILRRDKQNNNFYVTNIEIVVRKIAPFTLHHSTYKKRFVYIKIFLI